LPEKSNGTTQTKRDTLVLQVGGWVDGPAPHHPEKEAHMLKRTRQRLGKKKGRSYRDGCPEEIL